MSDITPEKVAAAISEGISGWRHRLQAALSLTAKDHALSVTVTRWDGPDDSETVRHFRAVVVEGETAPALLTGALAEVHAERDERNAAMGGLTPPDGTGHEHFQEVAHDARVSAFQAFRDGEGTWVHVVAETTSKAFAQSDPAKLRAQLVKVAADVVCWIEAIDRRTAEAAQAEKGGDRG